MNLDVFKVYEEGKHRRYSLLFSVNGGGFAIAHLLADKPPGHQVIGRLGVWHLSLGLLLFTILMVYDIYKFGDKMSHLQKNLDPTSPLEIFGRVGKGVLLVIGTLLCLGWLLAGLAGR